MRHLIFWKDKLSGERFALQTQYGPGSQSRDRDSSRGTHWISDVVGQFGQHSSRTTVKP
jgi:hypothetical protein